VKLRDVLERGAPAWAWLAGVTLVGLATFSAASRAAVADQAAGILAVWAALILPAMTIHRRVGAVALTSACGLLALAGAVGALALLHDPLDASTDPVRLARVAAILLGALALAFVGLRPALVAFPAAMKARRDAIFAGAPPRLSAAELLCTSGGAGWSPTSPGTLGAVAALPVGCLLAALPRPAHLAVVALLTGLTLIPGRAYMRHRDAGDPQEIVLDESIGVLLALAFVPWTFLWAGLAFGMFRLLDILKPFPVGWVDRNVKGALGVMGDDVVAGLLAGALLLGVRLLGIHLGAWSA
jgi:phosphatidylglycerophosphatase A